MLWWRTFKVLRRSITVHRQSGLGSNLPRRRQPWYMVLSPPTPREETRLSLSSSGLALMWMLELPSMLGATIGTRASLEDTNRGEAEI